MKKLLLLFAVLLSTVGAWAQTPIKCSELDANKYYRIYSTTRTDFGTAAIAPNADASKGAMVAYDANDLKQVWRFIEGTGDNAGKYLLYNPVVNKYLKDVGGSYGVSLTDAESSAVYYTIGKKSEDESEELFTFYWEHTNPRHWLHNEAPALNGWNGNGHEFFFLEEAETYFPIDTRNRTASNRKVGTVSINGVPAYANVPNVVTLTHEGNGRKYVDLTETETLTVVAGDEVKAAVKIDGSWMHAYVYIDEAGDGFTAGLADDGYTPTGDLKSYSCYSTDTQKWVNKDGSVSSNNTLDMPSFTAPATPGTYRMRYKVDWNDIQPDGSGAQFTSAGGTIVDVMLNVVEAENKCQVKYSFTYKDVEKYTQEANCLYGFEYPEITTQFAYGVTASKPDGLVSVEDAVEGVVTKVVGLGTDGLPFELSESYATAKWYFMNIRSSHSDKNAQMKWVSYNASKPYTNTKKLTINDNSQWAFLGNPIDGIQVVNKAAGEGKTLGFDGTVADQTVLYVKDGATSWTIEQGNGGFVLRQGNNEYVHDLSSSLKIWKDANAKTDGGSALQVCAVEDAVAYEAGSWQSFWTQAKVYPNGVSATGTVYKHEMVMNAASNKINVHVVYSGGNHRIDIVGVDVVNNEGKVVASDYHAGFSGGEANRNDYTLSNLTEGATYLVRCYVVDGTNNLNKTTGKILTDAEHATNEEVETLFNAIKDVATARYNSVSAKQGTALGEYTEASVSALNDAITAATTASASSTGDLVDALSLPEIVLPSEGKFYRFQGAYDLGNYSHYYITGHTNADGGRIALTENGDDATTIFYYADGKLLSYASGVYFGLNASYYLFSTVDGAHAASTITFAESGRNVGTYTIKSDNVYAHYKIYNNTVEIDRCGSDIHNNDDWNIEEVTSLPVTITSAGYATFYCPVAVTLPTEGLKAYYVSSVEDGSAKMTEIVDGVIPANTGVILQGNAAEYLLTIGGSADKVDNKLSGTVASEYVTTESYVLSKQNDVVGFYKAAMNKQGNTAFLNNGFKAYLPIVSEARFFVFDFGGNETGIDELEGENGNVKTEIYDLAGRRVQNAQKGVFVVNGKVVIK